MSARNAGFDSPASHSSPTPRTRERLHRPRALEAVDLHHRVEHGQRSHPLRRRGGQLEAHRAADVVHHEVEALEPEGIDGGEREAPETRPAVVEVGRALGQAEPGQVECDAAQPARGELAHHLAVQEARRRNPVHAYHGLALALVEHEAAHAGGVEVAARAAVALDDLGGRQPSSRGRASGSELLGRPAPGA